MEHLGGLLDKTKTVIMKKYSKISSHTTIIQKQIALQSNRSECFVIGEVKD